MTQTLVPIEGAVPPAPLRRGEPGVTVLEPTGGWRALSVAELWRFRDLMRALVLRDVKLRYRQTLLGVAWVVILPLFSAGVLTFVFGSVAKLPSGGVPYFLIPLAGNVGWSFYSGVLSRGSGSLTGNAALVSKVFFPRALLPVSTIGSAAVDMVVSLALAVGLAATQGIYPHAGLLMAPVWLLLGLAVAFGPVLVLAGAMAVFRDVGYILPIALQALLYLSPVAYQLSAVPGHYRSLYELNPFTAPIEGLRKAILGVGHVPAESVVSSLVCAVVLLVCGAIYFRRHEQRFADVI